MLAYCALAVNFINNSLSEVFYPRPSLWLKLQLQIATDPEWENGDISAPETYIKRNKGNFRFWTGKVAESNILLLFGLRLMRCDIAIFWYRDSFKCSDKKELAISQPQIITILGTFKVQESNIPFFLVWGGYIYSTLSLKYGYIIMMLTTNIICKWFLVNIRKLPYFRPRASRKINNGICLLNFKVEESKAPSILTEL